MGSLTQRRLSIVYLVVFCLFSAVLAQNHAEPDLRTGYNLKDLLMSQTDYLVLSYDDWGFNGLFSHYGLPFVTVPVYHDRIPVEDPLFGQMPLSWVYPKYAKATLSGGLGGLRFANPFLQRDKQRSRFDYYRGDYSFLNFGLYMSGHLSETTQWSFSADRLSYDGYAAYYRRKPGQNLDPLSESYQLHLLSKYEQWRIHTSAAYDYYHPAVLEYGSSQSYPGWQVLGGKSQKRTSAAMRAVLATQNDSLVFLFSLDGFEYRDRLSPYGMAFRGEANRIFFGVERSFHWEQHRFALTCYPYKQTVFSQGGREYSQAAIDAGLRYHYPWRFLSLEGSLGLRDNHIRGKAQVQSTHSKRWIWSAGITSDFQHYPLFFEYYQQKQGTAESEKGFRYGNADLGLQLSWRSFEMNTALNYVRSTFRMPKAASIADTLFDLQKVDLDLLYLSESIRYTFPWKTEISGSIVLAPAMQNEEFITLQSRARLLQRLTLFKGNLHLYLAGEVSYQAGGERLIWLDGMRNLGLTDAVYFTNERLNFDVRVGAHVGTFHIFYAIYNVENRRFSSVAFMPYHNRLKVLGVEWSFIN